MPPPDHSDTAPAPTLLSAGAGWFERVRARADALAGDRNPAFDALRGLLALSICIYHMSLADIDIMPPAWSQAGNLRVNVFFTLSGFLITLSVTRGAAFNPGKFLLARSRRILPNYFAALMICLLMINAGTLITDPPQAALPDLVTHLTLTHGWFFDYSGSIVPAFWTLSHEWCFYLLALFTAPLLRGRRWWIVPAVMVLVAMVTRLGIRAHCWDLPFLNPLCIWDQFAFGIVGAKLVLNEGRRMNLILVALGSLIVLWGVWHVFDIASSVRFRPGEFNPVALAQETHEGLTRKRLDAVFFTSIFAVGVASLLVWLNRKPPLLSGLRWTPLPLMGKISYSTYLYHMPVIICFSRALRKMPDDSFWHRPGLQFATVLLAVYLVSVFCYFSFERPWMRRSKPAPAVKGDTP